MNATTDLHGGVGDVRLEFGVPSTIDAVAECRDRVGSFLWELDVARDQVDEIRLVVSELASNVVQHSERPTIDVELAATRNEIVVELPGGPAVDESTPPPPSEWSGRGLLIARSVADEYWTVVRGGEPFVRCSFRRRPSPS